ncbi:Glyoxylase, beta-lactamase superfamily II [Paenibacillus sp. UNCCL117]|uniref:MBL fold metallo-hydrolase n=1 Tax=unclassified Paenibacillus TaxID=185978 RepID=UPI00087E21F5|nr:MULTISPECIES: MBL fold metallo-hydrolase [unclassified Paenibacillus]SDD55729.1 Glyoxylase, beta-lactamase superfamily II [Paenibacillus sp. cl123]SFW51528.1 Glyoxylase, beta-lactamase superfamily II [Paenibacillus sp. UNCCL117]
MNTTAGIEAIKLTRGFNGSQGVIYPTLIWDEGTAILVDTGEPIHLEAIRDAMEQVGVPFVRMNRIILTHQDIDHIGGLPGLVQASAHPVDVMAHEEEKPYIEGLKPLIKLKKELLQEKLNSLPEDQQELRGQIDLLLNHTPGGRVSTVLKDQDVLPYGGGLTVIHTPGHTPGHISLYLGQSKTLIAGDAIMYSEGKLRKPPEQFTPDMEQAIQSILKLAKYDVETLICYHGGVYPGNAKQALAELAAECR